MADRYEPRQLPPVGAAPALWGAWNLTQEDWVRTPGPDRRPEWFTSEDRVHTWATQETTASRSRS